jgi:16S rRNA (guanine527-N7)-methyltransferase
MTNPEVQFVGIESIRKKTLAVNEMIAELGITNAEVLRTRIENPELPSLLGEVPTRSRGNGQAEGFFDYITARAVAYVDKLIPWAYHLLKKGGYFILMKQALPAERQALLALCKTKNLTLITEHYYTLFEEDIERVIYVLQKS